MKLPKNIKQIGVPGEGNRIYIEDYVETFLSRQDQENEHCGVLLGNNAVIHGTMCYFIYGAMDVGKLWNPSSSCIFLEQQWIEARKNASEMFPKAEICGWYIVRKRGEETSESQLREHHKNAFPNVKGFLLLREEEDQYFFSGAGDQWSREKGYFEYFERNEEMQKYMLTYFAQKPLETIEPENAIENFRKRVIKNKSEKKYEKKKLYRIAGVLAAAVVVLAAANIFRFRQLQNMEKEQMSNQEETREISSKEIAQTDSKESTQPESEAKEAVAAVIYQVKRGDTLSSICQERYGDTRRLNEICILNNITNENLITTGQQIILP